MLNGMSDGPRHPPYRTGSEPLPPPSRREYLVAQPIVSTRSKHVVVISDSQLWNRTRVQSFVPREQLSWPVEGLSFSHRLFSQECRGCRSSQRTGSEERWSPGTTGPSKATDSGG